MDWSLILDYGVKIAGVVIATLITTFGSILFAKLKAKIQDKRVDNFITNAVKAAEQLYPNLGKKTGKEKYEYVLNEVLAKFPNMTNNPHLKTLIEAAVYGVSEQVKQIAKEQGIEVEAKSTNKTLSSF
jgi:hypothetical protein